MGCLLSGMGSGRDARGGGGQGGGEELKNVEVPAGGEPGGDEAVRPHQKPADVAAPRPVGERRIIAADRQGPPVPRGTVEADKAGAESLDRAPTSWSPDRLRRRGRAIDGSQGSDRAAKRRAPLRPSAAAPSARWRSRSPPVKALRWIAGGGTTPPRQMKVRNRLERLRQAKIESRAAAAIRFVGMMTAPSRRETSTILRTTGARSTS